VSADRVSKATILVEHLLGVHQHCQHAKITPEVREAQRVYEQDVIEFWDERKAGDQAAIDRNQLYMSEVTQAECRAGIHRYCIHDEAHDDNEYMSSMGCAGAPVGQVWGTVNPGGTVTARGFTDNENYHDDTAVHPARSLVAYHPDDNTWVHTATGQTVQRQREIDAERTRRRDNPTRPADGPCTCPPDPINETEQCESCNDDFNRRYCEPDGWKNDAERVEHGFAPIATPPPPSGTTTSTGTTTGGGGMSAVSEAKGLLATASEQIETAQAMNQEVISRLEEAQQSVLAAIDESSQAAADEAQGLIQKAIEVANEQAQNIAAIPQTLESIQL
jgi:hypothetical protein